MADISKLNGYDIKDKVARESISSLDKNFESINNNLNDINNDISELNGIVGNMSIVGPFPLIVTSANAFNFGAGSIQLTTQEQEDFIDIIMRAKSLALHNVIINVIVGNYPSNQLLSVDIKSIDLTSSWGVFSIRQFILSSDNYFDFTSPKASYIQVRYDTENNQITSLRTNGQFFGNTFLSTNNSTEYTPTNDYHPATKKYVDDAKNSINNSLDIVSDSFETLNERVGFLEVKTSTALDYSNFTLAEGVTQTTENTSISLKMVKVGDITHLTGCVNISETKTDNTILIIPGNSGPTLYQGATVIGSMVKPFACGENYEMVKNFQLLRGSLEGDGQLYWYLSAVETDISNYGKVYIDIMWIQE